MAQKAILKVVYIKEYKDSEDSVKSMRDINNLSK